MTASLPTPGGSNGDWGSELNAFLTVSLNSDGTLIPASVVAAWTAGGGSGGGGGAPTGSAGGDLVGSSYPDPVVSLIGGVATAGKYARGNGTAVVLSTIQAADVPTLNQNTTGTAANVTATLDLLPAPAANVSLGGHKITSLANGTASTDAAAFGQTVAGGNIYPLTTPGDLFYVNSSGLIARLPVGSSGQVIGVTSGMPGYITSPAGFANPMVSPGDTILGGAGGAPGRLPIGTTSQALLPSSSGTLTYQQSVLNVKAFGAVGNGTTNDTTAIQNALTAAGVNGGTVYLPAATYKITSQLTVPYNVVVQGDGPLTVIACTGTATEWVFWHNTATGTSAGLPWASLLGGELRDFVIDGTAATGTGACGLHWGDAWGMRIKNLRIQNFTGTSQVGMWGINAYTWTEKHEVQVDIINCTNAGYIDGGGSGSASASWEYGDFDIRVFVGAGQTGITLQGGAYLTGSGLFRLRGNVNAGTGTAGPMLTITGKGGPSNNIYSKIGAGVCVQINCENNGTGTAPQTINFGATNNSISNCFGSMEFGGNSWTNSNAVYSNLFFGGIIQHDKALNTANSAPSGWIGTVGWVNAVTQYGADPTGTNDSTGAINNAINAVAAGGVVYLPAGTYNTNATLTASITAAPIFIVGDGQGVTIINFTGNGTSGQIDAIWMYQNVGGVSGWPGITVWGGGVRGLTIDGSGASAGTVGLHIGDGEEYQYSDLEVRHFNGAGSIGLHLDNHYWWTGRQKGKAKTLDCTTAVLFDVTSGLAGGVNFGYSDWEFDIFAYAVQNGVVMTNGANPYNSKLTIRGEWELQSSGTPGYALSVIGVQPIGGGAYSQVSHCELNIWAETNGGGAVAPSTIYLQHIGLNKIKTCHGFLVFGNAGVWGTANFSAGQTESWGYFGTIQGDTNLAPASDAGNLTPIGFSGAPVIYAPALVDPGGGGSAGNVLIAQGDYFATTLTQNITLTWGGNNSQPGPQRKVFVFTQASGTAKTVTWPFATSPSLTNPSVLWSNGVPGTSSGTPPAMPSVPGGILVVYLDTMDGATWYGSTPVTLPLTLVAATPSGGSALANGTPSFLSWTAPNDGNQHRVMFIADLNVTSTETGGVVSAAYTNPAGASQTPTLFAAGNGVSGKHITDAVIVESGSTVTVSQTSALTGGAATLYCEMWAA